MSKGIDDLKEWAMHNVRLISILPSNENLTVDTKLIDVLEEDVDEKYFLSEEKTNKLILDNNLSGTLNKMQDSNRQPKISILGNTSNTGYKSHDVHHVEGIVPTIVARDYKGPKQIAIPTITPDRIEKRQNGRRFKEDGEPMFTLTAQDRHGVALQTEEIDVVGNIYKSQGQAGKVYTTNGLSPTIQGQRTNSQGWMVENFRIRKLTPLECWRLQGFTDEQFYKAKNAGVSNSQLYKQAGNSVTVSVVDAIVRKL